MSRIRKRTNVGRSSRARMCTDKAPRDRDGARDAVDRRVAAGAYRESINCYPCRWCGFWHVGTRNQELMAGRRRN